MRLNVTIALSVSDANRIEKKMGRTPGQGRGPYVEPAFRGVRGYDADSRNNAARFSWFLEWKIDFDLLPDGLVDCYGRFERE